MLVVFFIIFLCCGLVFLLFYFFFKAFTEPLKQDDSREDLISVWQMETGYFYAVSFMIHSNKGYRLLVYSDKTYTLCLWEFSVDEIEHLLKENNIDEKMALHFQRALNIIEKHETNYATNIFDRI